MARLTLAARTLLSFFSFYVGWWACAFGASYGKPWLGPALMPIWISIHLFVSPTPRGELMFFVMLALCGFVVDSALMQFLFTIPGTAVAPLWLVSMWILLGLSCESMLLMRKKPWLLILSGAVTGPVSYFAGQALKILEYSQPLWLSLVIHGVIWAALTPTIFRLRDFCLMQFPLPQRPPAAN